MRLTIHHSTRYSFDEPVYYALQKVRLRPLTSHMQRVPRWDVTVDGGKLETSYRDHYGNHVDLVSLDEGTREVTIVAEGEVETEDTNGVFGQVYSRAPLWHFQQATPLTEPGPRILELSEVLTQARDQLEGLHALSNAILEAVPYTPASTAPETPAEEAAAKANGVCQDHANIFISAARAAGVPARYVSGYLRMDDQDQQEASHAWAEAHLPHLGWVGFDVSNGMSPDTRYVRLAIGRDAHGAAPISGLRLGAGGEQLIVNLQVQQ
jgi:transglutaminase-like putative cysteine protease